MNSHPLAEFALEHDADERDVKRAYARRLKTTRPDEDAAGFQHLHEAYQRALDYIRRRDAQGTEAADKLSSGEWLSPSPVIAPVHHDHPSHDAPPLEVAPPIPHLNVPAEERLEEENGADDRNTPRFVFSVGDFLAGMREDGRDRDPVAFRRWLQAEISGWPLTARPALASAIVGQLSEEPLDMLPDTFEILAEELGLDDIRHSVINPMEIARLRGELSRRFAADNVVVPSHRTRLLRWCRAHPIFAIWLIWVVAALLGAALRIATPTDVNVSAPDMPWYRSYGEKTDGPIAVNALDGADRTAADLLGQSAQVPADQAVALLDQVIDRLSDRSDLPNEHMLALALYNKGDDLQDGDRSRAYQAYGELQERFKNRKDHDLALLVAASYVNMGTEDFETNRLDTALASYDAVVSLYGEIDEGQIGMQLFKALVGQAETLIYMGRRDEALQKLADIDVRLTHISDPAFSEFGNDTKTLRAEIDRPQN